MRSRGISTFMDHCRGRRHHRLDSVYRMQNGLPLRSCQGVVLSDSESATLRASLDGVQATFETCPSVPVDDVLALEAAGSSVWAQVDADNARVLESCRLFVCVVLDSLRRDGNLEAVVSLWSAVVASDDRHQALMGPLFGTDSVVVKMLCFYLIVASLLLLCDR